MEFPENSWHRNTEDGFHKNAKRKEHSLCQLFVPNTPQFQSQPLANCFGVNNGPLYPGTCFRSQGSSFSKSIGTRTDVAPLGASSAILGARETDKASSKRK